MTPKPFNYEFDGVFAEEHHEAGARIPRGDYSELVIGYRLELPKRFRKHLLLFAGIRPAPGLNPTRNLLCFGVMDKRGRIVTRHGPRTSGGWKARQKNHGDGNVPSNLTSLSVQYAQKEATHQFSVIGSFGRVVATGESLTPLRFNGKQDLVVAFGFTGKTPVYEPRAKGATCSDLVVRLQ